MQIKELQEKVDKINTYFDDKYGEDIHDLHYLAKIGEEYGELCEALLAEGGYQRQEKLDAHKIENVNSELADVIISAIVLARRRGIELEPMILEKLEKVEKKIRS